MLATLFGTRQHVELLRKGTTMRRGHWRVRRGQMEFVHEHALNYREGMGGHQIAELTRKDAPNPQQGELFGMMQTWQQQHKTKLVVPARRGANNQQLELFGAAPDRGRISPPAKAPPEMTRHEILGAMGNRVILASDTPITSGGIDVGRETHSMTGKRYEHLVSHEEAEAVLKRHAEQGGTVTHGLSIPRTQVTEALERKNGGQEQPVSPPVSEQPVESGMETVIEAARAIAEGQKKVRLVVPAKPAQKEPWQMTRSELQGAVERGEYDAMMSTGRKLSEYARYVKHGTGPALKEAQRRLGFHLDQHHASAVTVAHAEGKPVPMQVLGSYGLRVDTPKEKAVRLVVKRTMRKSCESEPLLLAA